MNKCGYILTDIAMLWYNRGGGDTQALPPEVKGGELVKFVRLELKNIPAYVLEGVKMKWEGCLDRDRYDWGTCTLCIYCDEVKKDNGYNICPFPIMKRDGYGYCDYGRTKESVLHEACKLHTVHYPDKDPKVSWREAVEEFIDVIDKELKRREQETTGVSN